MITLLPGSQACEILTLLFHCSLLKGRSWKSLEFDKLGSSVCLHGTSFEVEPHKAVRPHKTPHVWYRCAFCTILLCWRFFSALLFIAHDDTNIPHVVEKCSNKEVLNCGLRRTNKKKLWSFKCPSFSQQSRALCVKVWACMFLAVTRPTSLYMSGWIIGFSQQIRCTRCRLLFLFLKGENN